MTSRPLVPIYMVGRGTVLYPDDIFDCLEAGRPVEVDKHPDGTLFVPCQAGTHSLDGQLSEDGKHYIGFTTWKEPPE